MCKKCQSEIHWKYTEKKRRKNICEIMGIKVEEYSKNPYKFFQASSLIKLYNEALSGSKLIKENKIAVLKIRNNLIYGYPLNLQIGSNSNADKLCNFSIAWVVSEHNLTGNGTVTKKELEGLYKNILIADEINLNAINEGIKKHFKFGQEEIVGELIDDFELADEEE
jgi:hypothetical protein